jgi:hypothetical protein
MRRVILIVLALALTGCSVDNDYAKISNKRACGSDDCGKDSQ